MPSRPREEIVDPDEPGFYHCLSRCVRRAFLCGEDPYNGKNYDHRKDWIQDRFEFLAGHMAVEVTATAILDNHLHTVLRNRPDLVDDWSDLQVAERWLHVCPGEWQKGPTTPPAKPTKEQIEELLADTKKLAECRKRLSSISWMMKLVKEPISRWANGEEDASGHFWAERFRSVRLLDIYAIVLCSMYVDLNLIRAKLAETPEDSSYTSARYRIQARLAQLDQSASSTAYDPLAAAWLSPIDEDREPPDGLQAQYRRRASDQGFLPMSVDKYLTLLDWSGRQIKEGKKGAIPEHLAPIFERLNLPVDHFIEGIQSFPEWFSDFAGQPKTLRKHAAETGCRWFRGCRR